MGSGPETGHPYAWRSASAIETQRAAAALGARLGPGACIALIGGLGAGKTTFVQGLAGGLGIAEVPSSPTFTLLQIYRGRLPLYHLDLYRLEGRPAEEEPIDWEEVLCGDGVAAIEWPEAIASLLPADHLRVELLRLPGEEEDARLLRWAGAGERHRGWAEGWYRDVALGD